MRYSTFRIQWKLAAMFAILVALAISYHTVQAKPLPVILTSPYNDNTVALQPRDILPKLLKNDKDGILDGLDREGIGNGLLDKDTKQQEGGSDKGDTKSSGQTDDGKYNYRTN